jgi:parallel beta-helix repeat protein
MPKNYRLPTPPLWSAVCATVSMALLGGCQGSAADAAIDEQSIDASASEALSASSGGSTIKPASGANKCMNTFYSHEENGSAVEISACTGSSAQKWFYADNALKVFGNKCLDVVDGVAKNGTQLQIWDCVPGSTNQKWVLSGNMFVWNNQWCLDLTGGNLADGQRLQIWSCDKNNTNQKWNFSGSPTNSSPPATSNPSPAPAPVPTPAPAPAPSQASGQPSNSINVLDYGVRGDGNTDNTGALQNAFNNARSLGKSVWIPAGTYKHSGIITLNGISVTGAGTSTALHATNQTNSAVVLTGNGASLSNVFTAVSAGTRSSQPYDCAVLIINASNATISNISVQGASANGIRIDNSSNCKVYQSIVNGSNADGIALVNGATNNLVQRCQVSNASDDSFSSDSYPNERQNSGNTFDSCYAGANYKQGRSYALMGSAKETIKNCVANGSHWHGIIAGTDPQSTTQVGYGFNISNNLVTAFASGLPVMVTSDGGFNQASNAGGIAYVSGTTTSGDAASKLGWSPITNLPSPSTFSSYTGGGPGSSNTPGNRQ